MLLQFLLSHFCRCLFPRLLLGPDTFEHLVHHSISLGLRSVVPLSIEGRHVLQELLASELDQVVRAFLGCETLEVCIQLGLQLFLSQVVLGEAAFLHELEAGFDLTLTDVELLFQLLSGHAVSLGHRLQFVLGTLDALRVRGLLFGADLIGHFNALCRQFSDLVVVGLLCLIHCRTRAIELVVFFLAVLGQLGLLLQYAVAFLGQVELALCDGLLLGYGLVQKFEALLCAVFRFVCGLCTKSGHF